MGEQARAGVPGLARELGALAAGLCRDAGIGLEVGPGGWSWDPVRRVIRVDARGLEEHGPEFCAGIVAHEVGHYYVSRYGSFPVDFPSLSAGRSLLNAIEDPRVDRWICRRYPGATPWQALAKVDELDLDDGAPRFVRFLLECAVEGDREWAPSRRPQPPEVAAALAATREARRTYALTAPPTDPEAPVGPEVPARYREEVWPLRRDARWLPTRTEQRVQLSALDALRIAAPVLDAGAALYLADLARVARWLLAHPTHAGRGRRLLEEGRGAEVVGQAMREEHPDRVVPPWAEELARALLDGVIGGRVPAPLLGPGGRRAPSRPREEPLPELPPLPPIFRPATDYDRALAQIADQVDALVAHLEEILRPRRRLRERAGYPTGRRVSLRRLMAFEADPRRYDELWVRPSIPDRREAAIGLLVDLSGSMRGEKARSALLGTILVAETLSRLGVSFRIDGFQDVLVPLHDFGEPFGPISRQRIAELTQEIDGCRPGGNNRPRYNDDGPCLREHAAHLRDRPASDRVLIVVSDGLPEGRRSAASDLREAVAALTGPDAGLRLVALGLGPDTEHVRTFYPEGVANVPVERFARTIGELVEAVLVGP